MTHNYDSIAIKKQKKKMLIYLLTKLEQAEHQLVEERLACNNEFQDNYYHNSQLGRLFHKIQLRQSVFYDLSILIG